MALKLVETPEFTRWLTHLAKRKEAHRLVQHYLKPTTDPKTSKKAR